MSQKSKHDKLQALFDKEAAREDVHSAVVGVKSTDGSLDFAAAAGAANPEGGAPLTPDSPYFIASVTKMYTAVVIMNLHAGGQIDLDQPISKYLPAELIDGIHVFKGQDYSRQIKVYQLLNQTSGLADFFDDKPKSGQSGADLLNQNRDREYTIDQITEMVRTNYQPSFAPGSAKKAHYSDTNFELLGALIEAVTGKSVPENFREMIFAPLGLEHSYVYDCTRQQDDREPALFYYKDRLLNIPLAMSSFAPSGSVVSTAPETIRFLQAFFEGQLFDPAFLDRMMQWNPLFMPVEYGYGIMRFRLPRIFSPFKAVPEMMGHLGSSGVFAAFCPAREVCMSGTFNQVAKPGRSVRFMIEVVNSL